MSELFINKWTPGEIAWVNQEGTKLVGRHGGPKVRYLGPDSVDLPKEVFVAGTQVLRIGHGVFYRGPDIAEDRMESEGINQEPTRAISWDGSEFSAVYIEEGRMYMESRLHGFIEIYEAAIPIEEIARFYWEAPVDVQILLDDRIRLFAYPTYQGLLHYRLRWFWPAMSESLWSKMARTLYLSDDESQWLALSGNTPATPALGQHIIRARFGDRENEIDLKDIDRYGHVWVYESAWANRTRHGAYKRFDLVLPDFLKVTANRVRQTDEGSYTYIKVEEARDTAGRK